MAAPRKLPGLPVCPSVAMIELTSTIGAPPGPRAGAAVQSVQQRAAGVGHLLGVIKARRLAVIDPFQRHAGNIGAQDLLRQRIAFGDAAHVVTASPALDHGRVWIIRA